MFDFLSCSDQTDIPDAPPAVGNSDTQAALSQHSEERETQESRKGQRESDAKTRKPVPCKLQLNVTVTSALQEGQLMEMRDAFLKYLAQQGEYDTYPFDRSALMNFTSNTVTMVTLLLMHFVHTLGT